MFYLKLKEIISVYESTQPTQHLDEDFHSFSRHLSMWLWAMNSVRPWRGVGDHNVNEPPLSEVQISAAGAETEGCIEGCEAHAGHPAHV